MDNTNTAYAHNGVLFSHKKEGTPLSFAAKWMELEDIMLGERAGKLDSVGD